MICHDAAGPRLQAGYEEATRPVQEMDDGAAAARGEPPPPPGPWERLWDASATAAILSLVEALAGGGPAPQRPAPVRAGPPRRLPARQSMDGPTRWPPRFRQEWPVVVRPEAIRPKAGHQ